jgi:hypothetical protein
MAGPFIPLEMDLGNDDAAAAQRGEPR